MRGAAVVFVHGLFSSCQAWAAFHDLIASDSDLTELNLLYFEYPSPKFNLNPLQRIPDYDVLADSLQTYLDTEAAEYSNVVLVSHSQGGLIVQRYLARMVMGARGHDLRRIQRIVMFACPNSGSEIFLLVRRRAWFWQHPQERNLRPLNEAVGATQQIVINRIVHANRIASDQCPVVLYSYAGERDNIVTATSAKGAFPNTGVLPGDHFSIIQPTSLRDRSYLALKINLMAAFGTNAGQVEPTQSSATVIADSRPGFADNAESNQARNTSHLSTRPDSSTVVAKWNPTSRTVDFILTPETALAWIRKLGEEEVTDD